MSHSVSLPLQQGIRFPKASQPRPPTACLTVSLPRGRRTWGSTFRTIDPVSNLGEPSTPVVRQFRAGSYKTCNLTTCANTRKHSLDLLIPVGPFWVTTLTDFRLISPYCSTLALTRETVSASRFRPNSVHCRMGFTPRHQRDGSMPS